MPSDEGFPLDHPRFRQAHRLYLVLTNHCNYACPWCSMYSSPEGRTWMSAETCGKVLAGFPSCEVQLEGGEPTLHPKLMDFVRLACTHRGCRRIILCTNGKALPREKKNLEEWLFPFGNDCTVKLSVNRYLLERDPGLLRLALRIREIFAETGGGRMLVVNVRLRKGDDDSMVLKAVSDAGLVPDSNVFYFRRYGRASGRLDWDAPVLAGRDFTMVNPDGKIFEADFVASSEAMKGLP
ncbi:MAG TPA: radical SAM protein [Thermodesulfobacteriota bacterium]|nr:radical SAM protein [Thermodesulfobacteriota bacterium]